MVVEINIHFDRIEPSEELHSINRLSFVFSFEKRFLLSFESYRF